MGGRSSRDTETNTSSESTQVNLQQIGGPAVVGSENVTIENVSGEVIGEGFDFASDQTDSALEFGAGVVQESTSIVETAFDENREAREQAFTFAGGAATAAFAQSEASRRDALDIANVAIQESSEARRDALTFGGGAIQEATGIIAQNTKRSIDAVNRARQESLEFGAGAIQAVANQAQSERAFLQGAQQDVFEFAGGAVGRTLDIVQDFTGQAVSDLGQAQAASIAAVSEATRSESAESLDKIIKLAGAAIAGIGLLVFMVRK